MCMQLYAQVYTTSAITTHEVLGLMARIVEREVVPVESGDSTASNAIWAVALIIIVALIVFGVWKSGILRHANNPTQKIDVEVSAPSGH
jgi:hypothetical protein